jgi:hypothetical protein
MTEDKIMTETMTEDKTMIDDKTTWKTYELQPKYKYLKDCKWGLAKEIIKKYPKTPYAPTGFVDRLIVGDPGIGKSMYCYKIGAKVFYELRGYTTKDDEEDAYKEALTYMLFQPKTFLNLIYNNLNSNVVSPFVCLDDASVHFGKSLYRLDPILYDDIESVIPQLRTIVTGFLINSPFKILLAKFLRDFCRHKVEIRRTNDFTNFTARAVHYDKNWLPDDVKYRIVIPFVDKFSVWVPPPFYKMYYDKKLSAQKEQAALVRARSGKNLLRWRNIEKNEEDFEEEEDDKDF